MQTQTVPRRGRPLGVQVARLILAGDVGGARALAGNRRSWSVPETRALVGAIRVANSKFRGCLLSFCEFTAPGADAESFAVIRVWL